MFCEPSWTKDAPTPQNLLLLPSHICLLQKSEGRRKTGKESRGAEEMAQLLKRLPVKHELRFPRTHIKKSGCCGIYSLSTGKAEAGGSRVLAVRVV